MNGALSALSGMSGESALFGGSASAFASLLTGLIAQYPMNEASGNALETVAALNGTAVSAPGAGTGGGFSYRSFTQAANNRFAVTPTNAIAGLGGSGLSWSYWLYYDSANAGAADPLSVRQTGGGLNMSFILRHSSNEFFSGNGSGSFASHAITAKTADTFQHWAFSWNNSTKELRWRVSGGTAQTLTTTYYPSVNCGGMAFGGYGTGAPFTGRLAILKIWSRSISDAEMLLDYNSGAGVIL